MPLSGEARPWLFEAFPGLRASIPWMPLVHVPTRVHPLERLSARFNREIWIKRDDETSPRYGGNKPRKLEFLLAEARARGRTALVTGGGLGTNHGLATAIFGKHLGFRVTLGLFDQPVTAHVRQNLRLYHAYGAEMHPLGSMFRAALRYYVTERIRRRRSYFIPPGGSSPVGALGYVDAGLEMALQVNRQALPLPEVIFLAAGTCGTLAGLVLGLRLGGLQTRVCGVQVAPGAFANPRAALRLARRTLSRMRRRDERVPRVPLGLDDFRMDTTHYGPGYGHATDAGKRAMALAAREENVVLDLTYTGKTLAALLEHVASGTAQGPVLFWNTFNSVDLSDRARSVDFHSLPENFHRFFEGDLVEG